MPEVLECKRIFVLEDMKRKVGSMKTVDVVGKWGEDGGN